MSVSVEELLFTIRYRCDTESHLAIRDQTRCSTCNQPCLTFCPAEVYTFRDGAMHVAYENCIECGTCRIACGPEVLDWNYPNGESGVQFRFG